MQQALERLPEEAAATSAKRQLVSLSPACTAAASPTRAQHVRAGRRERPRPRCLQGRGDERRSEEHVAPLYKNHGRTAASPTRAAARRAGRRERPRLRCLQGRGDERRSEDVAQLYKNHGADGESDKAATRA